jgi:hypothetical protein
MRPMLSGVRCGDAALDGYSAYRIDLLQLRWLSALDCAGLCRSAEARLYAWPAAVRCQGCFVRVWAGVRFLFTRPKLSGAGGLCNFGHRAFTSTRKALQEKRISNRSCRKCGTAHAC